MRARLDQPRQRPLSASVNTRTPSDFRCGLIGCAIALLLTACAPLKQTRIVGGQGSDHFGYYGETGYGLLQIGPSNTPKRITVIDARSYAIAPNGSRFRIRTEPHAFDIETKFPKTPYVRDRVYLLDSEGRKITRALKNGNWKFHFTLRTAKGVETRDFDADLWTFYYNPLIHGPPN